MSRPTLSLLVPAYNAAAFLPRLLASAHAQTVPFDEIWIHDDCSTDATAEVARSFGANVLRSSTNVGCTEGKARLLRKTSCEWVHFHDADDELLPEFTAAAHEVIASGPPADAIIVGNEERSDFDPNHLSVAAPSSIALKECPLLFSIDFKVNAISGVYRRAFLVESNALSIPAEERYNEDQAIQLNLVMAGARFSCVERILVRSYQQRTSMSKSNALKCLHSHYHVLIRALGNSFDEVRSKDVGRAVSRRLWGVAAGAARFGDFGLADEAALLAGRLAPVPKEAGRSLFRMLAAMNPRAAVRLREMLIRTLKPELRAS